MSPTRPSPTSTIGLPPTLPARAMQILVTDGFPDYRLIDSGNGRKLERIGSIVVDRPEPQALWRPTAPEAEWSKAHAIFSGDEDAESGRWRYNAAIPESWPIGLGPVRLVCRLSAFRHLGIFPEQLPHWSWMLDAIAHQKAREPDRRPRVLNLFAYTGAASLLAAEAGAEVTHVDASKKAIAWAKENQAASELASAPIRWILDDARKFVAREVRRERQYDIILIDPPKFGRGPANETWDIFEHLGELMRGCAVLLEPTHGSLVLTAYAIRASALMLEQVTGDVMGGRRGRLESGELAIREERGGRLVPTSLFARWSGHADAT